MAIIETPIFDLPYPDGAESPDGAAQVEAAVKRVEVLLATIEGLITGAPAPGELLVVNGTSDPVYKAVTGDLTVNSAGVSTIANLAVTAAKIAEKAVETAKINDLAVTEAKLAALAVTTAKLAAEAVETGKIKNLAVTEAKLAAGAVTEAKLADGAVSSRKLKPTTGIKEASGGIAPLGAAADVPGTELVLPAELFPVKMMLIVWATFRFHIPAAATTNVRAHGHIRVDGAMQGLHALHSAAGAGVGTEAVVATRARKEVAAEEAHTIELSAARELFEGGGGVTTANLMSAGTGYSYLLHAA